MPKLKKMIFIRIIRIWVYGRMHTKFRIWWG